MFIVSAEESSLVVPIEKLTSRVVGGLVERKVIHKPYARSRSPAPEEAGVILAQSKDKESDRSHDCRNVQFELEAPTCQFQHGISPVYAGRPANWLKVGFGGYEEPGRITRGGS